MSVRRLEFRGRLAAQDPKLSDEVLSAIQSEARKALQEKHIMTLGLYAWGRQLFLYVEALDDAAMDPEFLLPSLSPLLSTFPHGEEDRKWAYMYPIFYHAVPESEEDWKRPKPAKRVGRIALLDHDKLFDYLMHHRALVREGALQGDRYQFISHHEDMLFSYFEEPRTYVNLLCDPSKESECIKAWMDAVPEDHFVHLPGSSGQNFLVLPEIIAISSND